MTKKEVIKMFEEQILPYIKEKYEKNGNIDKPARAEAWNNFTDSLCKEGNITLKQYESWTSPF